MANNANTTQAASTHAVPATIPPAARRVRIAETGSVWFRITEGAVTAFTVVALGLIAGL